jgi:hypothetical protein
MSTPHRDARHRQRSGRLGLEPLGESCGTAGNLAPDGLVLRPVPLTDQGGAVGQHRHLGQNLART